MSYWDWNRATWLAGLCSAIKTPAPVEMRISPMDQTTTAIKYSGSALM